MKRTLIYIQRKLNKPLITFALAVGILLLVSNIQTKQDTDIKSKADKTVDNVSENLNKAAGSDVITTPATKQPVPDDTTVTSTHSGGQDLLRPNQS